MGGTVYIVHCVDAEGPLYEDFNVAFQQIDKIFGIQIEPTKENLNKLRCGQIDLKGKEKAVMDLVDIHKASNNKDWDTLEQSLEKVTSKVFRNRFLDSNGQGWKYNWFCLDHVGFNGKNPRKRDAGHHKIFDRYSRMVNDQKMGDIVQFHHHPVSHSGNYNECGMAYWGRNTLNDILSRKIIDRKWFPTAYRPGFHTERPDSNWFLEQWIPFDYGNQSVKGIDTEQPDLANGRFGDWRIAPLEWKPYHPSHDNYQKKGTCHRWITRCLNMYARLREITQEDVMDAFEQAYKGENTILAFTDHDFKDMAFDVNRVRGFIEQAIQVYSEVRFEYTDAITAMRKCCDLKYEETGLQGSLGWENDSVKLIVRTEADIFGLQPYLAIKTRDERYIWDNFDFGLKKNTWSYTFDQETIPLKQIDKIGIAVNNKYGKCEIINFEVASSQWEKNILN